MKKIFKKYMELPINILYYILCFYLGKLESVIAKGIILLFGFLVTNVAKLSKKNMVIHVADTIPSFNEKSFFPMYRGVGDLRCKFVNCIIIIIFLPMIVLLIKGFSFCFPIGISYENSITIGVIILFALTTYCLPYKNKYKKYLRMLSKNSERHIKSWTINVILFITMEVILWWVVKNGLGL